MTRTKINKTIKHKFLIIMKKKKKINEKLDKLPEIATLPK